MNSFLVGLGTRIADRWVTLLALPGLLWTATLVAGVELGQEQAFNVMGLSSWLIHITENPARNNMATIFVIATVVLLASVSAALASSALGALCQHLLITPGDLPPASWIRFLRQARWNRATANLKSAVAGAVHPDMHQVNAASAIQKVRRARQRQARIGVTQPTKTTRVGDRFDSTLLRIRYHNGVDLHLIWPRLWTVLPEEFRTDLSAAQEAYAAAARLAGWGFLYISLTAAWWPAAFVGTVILLAAYIRIWSSAENLASLIEAAVDIHAKDLAAALGIPSETVDSSAELGRSIAHRLQGRNFPHSGQ